MLASEFFFFCKPVLFFQLSGRESEGRIEEERREMYRAVDEKVNRMKSWLSERQRVKLSHLEHQKQNLQHKMDSLCETESTLKASLGELQSVSFLEVRLITNIRKRRKWLTVSFPQVLRGCFRQYSSPNPNCYYSPKVKKNVVH